MVTPFQLPEEQLLLFAALFLRVTGFFVAMPVIGTPSVPVSLKVLFSLTFAVIMYPVVQKTALNFNAFSDMMLWIALKEVVVGLFLGFLVRMFFFAMTVVGEIVGVSSGVAAAQMFNPATGDHNTVFESFHSMMGTVIFLILGGHHLFIAGFAQSFDFLPVTSLGFNVMSVEAVVNMGQEIIATGFRLAAPVWVAVLVANLALGFLGRAVPQINIFVMSFHVTILLAFGVLFLMLPLFVGEMGGVIEQMAIGFGEAVKTL